jgi:NTP pyrophosphatase (non-canonical NTP hydrolase)
MNDCSTSVDQLRQLLRQFVDERDWQPFHNPKNLAMSLAIEAAELMEHFQWLTPEEATQAAADPDQREAICDEIADCLAYVLAMANTINIDLSTELLRKMEKNAVKYPIETSRGRFDPPSS